MTYLSKNTVGSGSFGQCFQANYRGVELIVKEMRHTKSEVGQERAEVIDALGDQANLPMFFGVITKGGP